MEERLYHRQCATRTVCLPLLTTRSLFICFAAKTLWASSWFPFTCTRLRNLASSCWANPPLWAPPDLSSTIYMLCACGLYLVLFARTVFRLAAAIFSGSPIFGSRVNNYCGTGVALNQMTGRRASNLVPAYGRCSPDLFSKPTPMSRVTRVIPMPQASNFDGPSLTSFKVSV